MGLILHGICQVGVWSVEEEEFRITIGRIIVNMNIEIHSKDDSIQLINRWQKKRTSLIEQGWSIELKWKNQMIKSWWTNIDQPDWQSSLTRILI